MQDLIDVLLNDVAHQSKQDTYEKRIAALRSQGRDTSMIEEGIKDTTDVLERGTRSFVIYGEPQSGKTEFMIALTCKLVDLGYRTIFVVMNDNTELEGQNFDRFHAASQLNPTPLRDTQIVTMSDADLKQDRVRIIFCRKNSRNLQKLITLCRHMRDRIVIDDEADYATPNTRINQNKITAINEHLGALGQLGPKESGVYIGVTATPGRLDLNNTFLNNSADWVFLRSYDGYKGRSFFFPVSLTDKEASDYNLVKLPDDGDDPRLLRHAVFRFLIRVAILNCTPDAEETAYSMLIHTAGKTHDHIQDYKSVTKILRHLNDEKSAKRKSYFTEIQRLAINILGPQNDDRLRDLLGYIIGNIGRSEVLVINHKNDKDHVRRAGQPKVLFTFAIGGNIVSRGLTFERLLTFYFSRNVKGRLQQNTYIQRARMFGNRPYSQHFELCVPETLYADWADLFQEHELSLRLARAGYYAHIQGNRSLVADKASIDTANIEIDKSERPVGDIVKLSDRLRTELSSHTQSETLTFLQELISTGVLPQGAFDPVVLNYIRETCAADQSDVHLVLKTEAKGVKAVQRIENYSDADVENILRSRGGIVHAMLNKRPEYYSHRHFILPIANDAGNIRFLYKSNLGHSVFKNVRQKNEVGAIG